MKIAVMNFSGNVGKSTISRHLLLPRIKEAVLIPVETINSDGGQDEAVNSKRFVEINELINISTAAIVDVGASNIEDFMQRMGKLKRSHEDFDFFVIPVTPEAKGQRDTINIIDVLAKLGVPVKKIRVVFNKMELGDEPADMFAPIFARAESHKQFTLTPDAFVHQNDIFARLSVGKTIKEIVDDKTDYKEKIKNGKDGDEKLIYAQAQSLRRMAEDASDELDRAFKALFK